MELPTRSFWYCLDLYTKWSAHLWYRMSNYTSPSALPREFWRLNRTSLPLKFQRLARTSHQVFAGGAFAFTFNGISSNLSINILLSFNCGQKNKTFFANKCKTCIVAFKLDVFVN